jgi:hypothetical protein
MGILRVTQPHFGDGGTVGFSIDVEFVYLERQEPPESREYRRFS